MPPSGSTLHLPFPAARFLPYLTWTDVAALPKDDALVVLPIASIEQHGPHLPLVSDTLLGQELLAAALDRLAPSDAVWVLPMLTYGKSNEHAAFPGTIALSASTLAAVVVDIGTSVARAGFRRLALVNSHGGNPPVLDHAARDLRQATGLIVFSLFMFRMDVPYTDSSADEAHWGTHAGEWETSVLLSLAPDLVHLDRTRDLGGHPTYATPPRHLKLRGPITYAWLSEDLSISGNLGDPRTASAERGDGIVASTVERLAEVLAEMATFEMPTPAGAGVSDRPRPPAR